MNERKIFHNTEMARLDQALAKLLGESRNQVEALVRGGNVWVDGEKSSKGGVKLKGGERIEVEIPLLRENPAMEVEFEVEILHEEEHFMVLNKPSGVVVHGAPSVKEATLVDWLKKKRISLSTLNGEERHGIVHRLDKETSGAIVIAKSNEAHRRLSLQLQEKSMGRYYLAIIDHPLKEDQRVECHLGRHPHHRLKIAKVPVGRYAKSAFVKLEESIDGSKELIAAKLFTGRTHQIRAHLELLGRHILHDELYGYRGTSKGRIFLHAYGLYFDHPMTGESMFFKAPLFEDMIGYLQQNFPSERLHETLLPDAIVERFSALG